MIPREGIFLGVSKIGSFMSGQVLSVLVSARLSGLVYKVLIEHEVCTE